MKLKERNTVCLKVISQKKKKVISLRKGGRHIFDGNGINLLSISLAMVLKQEDATWNSAKYPEVEIRESNGE